MSLLAFVLMLVAVTACGRQAEVPEETAAAESDASVEAEAARGDNPIPIPLLAVLEAADRYDGAADKVVAKCLACNLGMDGSSDHAMRVEGYELHFCSEGCKESFEGSVEEALLAVKIPEI